jgi:SPP1 family holin
MAENQVPQQNVQTVVIPAEAPAIDKSLVVRSIVYLILVANAVAAHFGIHFHMNGNEDFIYNIVSDVLLVGGFVQAYWKNNNISKAARIIDKVAEQIDVFADHNPMAQPEAPVAPVEAPVAQPAQPVVPVAPAQPEAPVADQTNQQK